VFSVTVFIIEYILRVWTSDLRERYKNTKYSRLKYVFSPMAIIDLLAVLPVVLNVFIDLRFLRILRLTRILRVFKLSRYSNAINLLRKVVKDKKEELLATIFITFILLFIAATLMYNIEHQEHKDAFPNILSSFWWAVATLTTIGYGDVFPVTALGKFLSALIALLGIGLVALPTGIISSGFIEEISNRRKNDEDAEKFNYCPHCGKKLP
jgi:voltage-gated potassium channel